VSADAPAAAAPRHTRAEWKQVANGLTLIVLGTFLLLTTLGKLPWSFWGAAIRVWPVLIVSAGIRIAFERSRAPWATLLGPVMIAGVLFWIAQDPRPPVPGPWRPLQAERPQDLQTWRLAASTAFSDFNLRARPLEGGLLLQGRAASGEGKERITVRADPNNTAKVSLVNDRRVWVGRARSDALWDLDVAADLPVRLELDGVGLGGRVAFAEGQSNGAILKGAFNNLEVSLPPLAEDKTVRVEGVFNQVRLVVPRGTSVRVRSEGVFNRVDPPAAAEGPAYRVEVHGLANDVAIDQAGGPVL
jgi:hypothetical protein